MKRILLLVALIVGATSSASAQDPNLIGAGARLWAANCTRCHNARSPAERTDRQWTTIGQHMRARANMTKAETAKIIAYLQAVNLPPSTAQASLQSREPVAIVTPWASGANQPSTVVILRPVSTRGAPSRAIRPEGTRTTG